VNGIKKVATSVATFLMENISIENRMIKFFAKIFNFIFLK